MIAELLDNSVVAVQLVSSFLLIFLLSLCVLLNSGKKSSKLEYYWDPLKLENGVPQGRFVGEPKILVGDPHILVGDPQIFIGDPQIFIGDPQIIIGDSKIFIWDPLKK